MKTEPVIAFSHCVCLLLCSSVTVIAQSICFTIYRDNYEKNKLYDSIYKPLSITVEFPYYDNTLTLVST